MNYDRKQVSDYYRNKSTRYDAAARDSSIRKLLEQSAVKSEKLLNDSKWDTYLTYLQQQIDQLQAVCHSATQKLQDPKVVDHNEIMAAKLVFAEAQAMIKAFEIAVDYPSQIIKAAKELKSEGK